MKQAFNPFLPLNQFVPDGEPHVFGDRVYLFGSHEEAGGDTYCMLDYEFFSAPISDLSSWTSRGINYKASQDPLYGKERPYMYAPDVVRGNDGRYYLYYSLSGYRGKGGYHGPISVAVCDTPDGKYEYLGAVRNKDGSPFHKFVCFDPAVMNDDGVIRLYYGTALPFGMYLPHVCRPFAAPSLKGIYGKTTKEICASPGVWGANMLTLCDDMLTVQTESVRIIPEKTKGTDFEGHGFFEGASIRKINGIYYFIYSSQLNHELCYATSRYPDRAFRYGGTIVSAGDVGLHGRKECDSLNAIGTTHGSLTCINGQWYIFYHRLTHGSDYSRQACAEPVKIRADGSIAQVEISSCGLNGKPLAAKGKFPAAIACNITNGAMPKISNRKYDKPIPMVMEKDGESLVAGIDSKTTVTFKWFDFENDMGHIRLDIEATAPCEISVFANDVKIAAVVIESPGRRTVAAQYRLTDTKKQALSVRSTGPGTLDFYTLEFC